MTDLTLLETDRLILSGWRADQIDDLVRLHGDPVNARYLSDEGMPWSREKCEASLASWIELFETRRMGKMRLTRKDDGVLVGRSGFGIHPPTGEPEIGFALYPEHHGRGYATEAASALRDWLFAETEWDHFIGMADTRNAASLAALARIGMRKTHVEPATMGLSTQFHILTREDHRGL
jgi:[ribosomal protein S5]-alanine N-acetyltransferase